MHAPDQSPERTPALQLRIALSSPSALSSYPPSQTTLHCSPLDSAPSVHGPTSAPWAGAVMPEHAHPHEQMFTLLEGEFELTISGEARIQKPGAVAVIAPNAPHSGRAITACRIIDVFSPVREDMR